MPEFLLMPKNYYKPIWRQKLDELIKLAGNRRHLSLMLTSVIHTHNPERKLGPDWITGWHARGKISPLGALLVEMHPELNLHFTKEELRPDINIFQWHDYNIALKHKFLTPK